MKQMVKTIALKGIVRTLGLMTRKVNRIRIFTYHSVQDHSNIKAHMPPRQFEEHVRYLSEKGYRSLCISDIADQWPKILTNRPAVVLTFDDGLYNHWAIICDILAKYGMSGTFFVPTAYIDENRQFPSKSNIAPYQDTEMLSWLDLREMVKAGFEIGAHSHTHVMVARQNRKRAINEIVLPKNLLEEKLGVEIKSFAYPKGHSDSFADWTKEILREVGYCVACTQVGGPLTAESDLLELPRQGMNGTDTLAELKLKLNGYYDCLRWLRRRP